MVTATLAPVARPDGSYYRPRKPPELLSLLWGSDEYFGILVIRTHDIDAHAEAATRQWQQEMGAGCPLPTPRRVWVRHVPWDAVGNGSDSTWITVDPTEKGAVPAIEYTEDDPR